MEKYYIKDNGIFPNNPLPVLHYIGVLKLPVFFASWKVKRLLKKNNWGNNWVAGVYTFPHYHSITHEAIGVCKGATMIQLGGDGGVTLTIKKGDVLVIPAGVAHKNLGAERQVTCVGGYPDGREYDMNYGRAAERPQADNNIAAVPLPTTDPVFGGGHGLVKIWRLSKVTG